MPFSVDDFQALLRLLESEPQWREQLRTLLVTDALHALPERFDRLTRIVEQLAQAEQRTAERVEALATRVEELAEAQKRTEVNLAHLTARVDALAGDVRALTARVDALAGDVAALTAGVDALAGDVRALTAHVDALTSDLRGLTEEVRKLTEWQRGEVGRREGERYERQIVKRAPALFAGGDGGATDEPVVRQRLTKALEPLLAAETFSENQDPFLADLLWWKDGQVLVVEVSVQVSSGDVLRARRRAETLQRAKIKAMGMVIGEEWADPDVRSQAEAAQVQWQVGDDFSEGWLAFRRLASSGGRQSRRG